MQDEHTVAQSLAAEGIADYPQDLRELSAAELQRLFAFRLSDSNGDHGQNNMISES